MRYLIIEVDKHGIWSDERSRCAYTLCLLFCIALAHQHQFRRSIDSLSRSHSLCKFVLNFSIIIKKKPKQNSHNTWPNTTRELRERFIRSLAALSVKIAHVISNFEINKNNNNYVTIRVERECGGCEQNV